MVDELLWFVRVVEVLSLVVGSLIVYIAFKGFRRTKHHAILLSAIGFTLLAIGGATEGVMFELFDYPLLVAHAFRAVIGMLGFLVLLASIRRMHD